MTNPFTLGDQTLDVKELFHYTDKKSGDIDKGNFWTEFNTSSSSDAKRMTGSTNHLNYRAIIRVNSDQIYDFFEDGRLRNGPVGLGMGPWFLKIKST